MLSQPPMLTGGPRKASPIVGSRLVLTVHIRSKRVSSPKCARWRSTAPRSTTSIPALHQHTGVATALATRCLSAFCSDKRSRLALAFPLVAEISAAIVMAVAVAGSAAGTSVAGAAAGHAAGVAVG